MPILAVSAGTLIELPGNRKDILLITIEGCGDKDGRDWIRFSIRHPTRSSNDRHAVVLSQGDSPRRIGFGTYMAVVEATEDERADGLVALSFDRGKAAGVRFQKAEKKAAAKKTRPPPPPAPTHAAKKPARHYRRSEQPGMRSKWAEQIKKEEGQ